MNNIPFLEAVNRQYGWLKNIPLLPQIFDEWLKIWTLFSRPDVFQLMIEIVHQVKSWENVTSHYHRFGGLEFRISDAEFAHLHGNGLLDILFYRKIRDVLVKRGLAFPHHVYAESGWVSIYIHKGIPSNLIVQILHLSYQYQKKALSLDEILHEINKIV